MSTSTEPREMCTTAIYHAGLNRVVYSVAGESPANVRGTTKSGIAREEVIERTGGSTDVDGPVLEAEGLRAHEAFYWEGSSHPVEPCAFSGADRTGPCGHRVSPGAYGSSAALSSWGLKVWYSVSHHDTGDRSRRKPQGTQNDSLPSTLEFGRAGVPGTCGRCRRFVHVALADGGRDRGT